MSDFQDSRFNIILNIVVLLILQVKNAKTGWCFAPTKQVALYHEVIPAMLKANQVPKPPPKPKKGANIETSAATQTLTP